jgi:RNA polymerase sigma factor (sigma-70 family)
MSESSLIKRFIKGKKDAFEELYNQYSPALFAVCLRYARNRDDAADLLHDIFVKIYEKRSSFDTNYTEFMPWARRVAVNHILNKLKSTVRFTEIDASSLPETPREELTDKDMMLEQLSDPAQVIELLQSLPSGYRTVFNMCVFEEMSHSEIASALGISEGTSKSQFHRARMFLQNRLTSLQPPLKMKAS